jgi:chemotaxis protein CheD
MERLINEILRLGGRRANLEAKVFGGARVLAIKSDIGRRNGDFVQAYLDLEGLPLVAQDLGGIHPRKVIFFPKEGLVRVRRLATGQEPEVSLPKNGDYSQNLATQAIGGPIEIF